MNRIKLSYVVAALMASTAVVSFLLSGWDTNTQLATAMFVAQFAVRVLGVGSSMSLRGHFANLVGADGDFETLAAEFKGTKTKLEKSQEDLREQMKGWFSDVEAGRKTDRDTMNKLDEKITETLGLGTKFQEISDQVNDIAQKFAKRAGKEEIEQKSFGELLIESDDFKTLKEKGFRGSMKFEGNRNLLEGKAITTVGAAGLKPVSYQDSLVSMERRRLTIRDLLTVIPVTTGEVQYAKQTLRTNNANVVAEGAAKPYSDYLWAKQTVTIRTLAHLAKLTRQALDDAPRLAAEVESELRFGLGLLEETQLLYGSGTGENITGIVPQATAYVAPIVVDDATKADVLRLAILQVALTNAYADGMVLNPADWASIELLKDSTGNYLFANIQGTVSPRLWGIPVVDTPAMAIDDFLVGAFKYGANLYDRMGVEVLISTENVDDFEKNMATMRCEERIALGVRRPYAFVTGDFTTALA